VGRWTDPRTMSRRPRVESLGAVLAAGEPPRHRVLLVEDHASVADATAELMRLHGLEVRVATTGSDALEMADAFNPILILCDLRLPDMTGLDVAAGLRVRCLRNDLLIAIITATSVEYLREFVGQAGTCGVNVVLSKPLTNETLIALISQLEVLHPRQASRDLRESA
jgi:CheY-like chemotaxis protein